MNQLNGVHRAVDSYLISVVHFSPYRELADLLTRLQDPIVLSSPGNSAVSLNHESIFSFQESTEKPAVCISVILKTNKRAPKVNVECPRCFVFKRNVAVLVDP